MKNFGDKLRQLRIDAGLTQRDVAERTGLKLSALSHYEHGRREPSLRNLRRLSLALGISADELLRGD